MKSVLSLVRSGLPFEAQYPHMHGPIPKRIIQTGKHAEQPLKNRAMMANVRLLNPDYEYLFFDNENVRAFLQQEFPQYVPVFEAFPYPIQRYDFFRYLAVYRYGGFYFDLDVLLASDLSSVLSTGCVFPFEGLTLSRHLRDQLGMDWEIGNYAFGAAAGHPFLAAVIDNCVRAQRDPAWVLPMMQGLPGFLKGEFIVLNTTGPGLLSRTFAEHSELTESVAVLFPDDVCDVRTWNRFGEIGVHLMDGTWRFQGGFWRKRVAKYWELWQTRAAVRNGRRLGKTRSRAATAAPATEKSGR